MSNMDTKGFVKDYLSKLTQESKNKYVKSHIVKYYMPFYDKCKFCDELIEATSGDEIKEYFTIMLKIIKYYSDINVSIDGDSAIVDFDLLDEYDLIDIIFNHIKKSELEKINIILKMKKKVG